MQEDGCDYVGPDILDDEKICDVSLRKISCAMQKYAGTSKISGTDIEAFRVSCCKDPMHKFFFMRIMDGKIVLNFVSFLSDDERVFIAYPISYAVELQSNITIKEFCDMILNNNVIKRQYVPTKIVDALFDIAIIADLM